MRAIDVLKYLLAKAESEVPEGHQIVGLNVPVDIVREIIGSQPDNIRCRDCRYSEYDALYDDRYCHYDGKADIVPDEHYCGYAKRRTDE